MGEQVLWGSKNCKNKVEYHNSLEDSYYWTRWAHILFDNGEWTKIEDESTVQQIITLWRDLLNKIEKYITEEQLVFKWKLELEQLKMLNVELESTKKELDDIIKTGNLKNLCKSYERSYQLKSKI